MMTVEENHYEELNPEINISDEINHSDSNNDDNSIDEKTEMEHSYVEDNFDNRYLHKDSNLKLIEVCHLLLAFKNRSKLDDTCFEALLVLIHFFLPFDNKLPTNKTKLQRILSDENHQINHKRYCSQCQSVITESKCQNRNCTHISNDFDTIHFISIKKQLKQNLEYFHDQIVSYKNENNNLTDITNSERKNEIN